MANNNVVANTNSKTEEQKKEPCRIELTQHEQFDNSVKTKFITSIELSQKISAMFGEVFSDYVGCKIKVNDGKDMRLNRYVGPQGNVYVELYFKDLPETGKGIKSIHPRNSSGDDKKNDLGRRLINTISAGSACAYSVNDDTYQALEEFVRPYGFQNHGNVPPIMWSELTQEVQEVMNSYSMNKREVLVSISGLSLYNIIVKMFGTEVEGTKCEYQISVVSRILSKFNGGDEMYVFSISQLSNGTVRKLEEDLGISARASYYSYR